MVAIKLSELKKGDFFTRKPLENPSEKQVLIRDNYDRTEKKFSCIHFDDICDEIFLKGSTVVYTGFTF